MGNKFLRPDISLGMILKLVILLMYPAFTEMRVFIGTFNHGEFSKFESRPGSATQGRI